MLATIILIIARLPRFRRGGKGGWRRVGAWAFDVVVFSIAVVIAWYAVQ
jgi:hypothetical protein